MHVCTVCTYPVCQKCDSRVQSINILNIRLLGNGNKILAQHSLNCLF